MNLGVAHPWVLWALVLALLPLLGARPRLVCAADRLLPRDLLSELVEIALRLAGAAAVAALVVAVAGPFRAGQTVDRIGSGAQMVLLVDRSQSMDQPFFNPNADPYQTLRLEPKDSKSRVARQLVADLVARRADDMFGMIVFSTNAIDVLPPTHNHALVQAAIRAGKVGRGLAETDVGAALEAAVQYFEHQRFRGSRMVMLISDGAAQLSVGAQTRIRDLLERNHVTLYWIYIRTRNGPGLFTVANSGAGEQVPQRALHRFFSSLTVPYHAYTAESADALEQAITDIERQQSLPIRYPQRIPRQDLTEWALAAALVLVTALLLTRLAERRRWL